MQNPTQRGSFSRSTHCALCIAVSTVCATTQLSAQEEQLAATNPQTLARQEVSVQEPEQIQRTVELPNLGKTIVETKHVDLRTGNVTGGAVDESGRAVDLSDLVRQEVALRLATPEAKLHPDLRAALKADPETAQDVVLWLVYDDRALDQEAARLDELVGEDRTDDALALAEERMSAYAQGLMQQTNAAVVADLAQLGVDVRYVSTTAPAIFVDATRAECLAIAASGRVDTLYLESKDEQDTNSSANGTHRSTTTYNNGWRGAGIRVAVLENNGIDPACPHLNVTQWFNAGTPNPDDHVHGTAGCVASQLSSRRGGAPDVSLYSANAASYSDTNITQAADWIIGRNIQVTNMSYGGNTNGGLRYKDRYFDFQSRTYQDSYVASAGNSGNWVGSPGTSWNCISVGAFQDNDNSNWTGDVMASFSSWRNPTTGCEKPNVSGVGHLVDTIGMAPDWLRNNYSGTSFSAPFTSAAVAVTMSRDGSANSSPEAAMAAIMATAWHNIEGSSRLSDLDGAGGLHQRAAANCGNNNRIRWITVNSGSFNNNGYRTYNMSLNGGDRTRVAIAWAATANSAYTSTVLQADLDITILQGSSATSGTSFGSSSSANNNFEIVEFTPPTTGTYTIRINDWSFNGASERVGIAWSQRTRDAGN